MSSINDVNKATTPEGQDDPYGNWDEDYENHRDALLNQFIMAQPGFLRDTRLVLARLDGGELIERIVDSAAAILDPVAPVLADAHRRTGGGCHPSWLFHNYRWLDDQARQQVDQQQAERDREYARLVVEGLKGRELTEQQRWIVWSMIQDDVAGIDPALLANLKPRDE